MNGRSIHIFLPFFIFSTSLARISQFSIFNSQFTAVLFLNSSIFNSQFPPYIIVSSSICPARMRRNMVSGYTVEYPTLGASLPDTWLA